MYGRILGFQRLARCPKWTPASIKSFTCTIATHCPPAYLRVKDCLNLQKKLHLGRLPPLPSREEKVYRSILGKQGQTVFSEIIISGDGMGCAGKRLASERSAIFDLAAARRKARAASIRPIQNPNQTAPAANPP